MASAAMATAAGATALLYYALGRHSSEPSQEPGQEGQLSTLSNPDEELRRKSIRLGSVRAPSTWLEAVATLSETLRFSYGETLGKWPITDLAFGINFLMKRQGLLPAATIYAGEGSHELKGQEVIAELKDLLILLTTCLHFSKKPFPLFLEATGYSQDSVLWHEPKAGLLKPSFTILLDEKLHCILLLVRGTHSVKDTLTAVSGAVVPFHHTVLDEEGVSQLVLGYAHCGMVAAARWIAQHATSILLKARSDNPTYKLKIVGHSLGGGTAALLTYILHERKDFSSAECICFAPAACMTWELAESGVPFTTSVISGSDIVPTFSAASVDDLRKEVTASAWVNDFRERVERIRFLKAVLHSTAALSNRVSSSTALATAKAGVSNAWQPVSNGTQVVMRQAQTVAQAVARTRPSLALPGWLCIGPRDQSASTSKPPLDGEETGETANSSLDVDNKDTTENGDLISSPEKESLLDEKLDEKQPATEQDSEWPTVEDEECAKLSNEVLKKQFSRDRSRRESEEGCSVETQLPQDSAKDELSTNQEIDGAPELSEESLCQQLEQELELQREACSIERQQEEEEAKKITQEEEESMAATIAEEGSNCIMTEPGDGRAQGREFNRFFPPGRILHVISLSSERTGGLGEATAEGTTPDEVPMSQVGVFLTDRAVYGRVHLSRNMIYDHYTPHYIAMMETVIEELESKVHKEDLHL